MAKPKVLIITTGGTIASRTGASLIEGSELVHAVPQLTQYADIEVKEFDILELDNLPKVDIVKDFAGFDSEILSYFLNRTNDGLVISSFAGGRLSSGMTEGVANLPENHKPIVISSSIRGGRIMGSDSSGSPIIIASDLPPNKARILLMLSLTNTSDSKQIQHYFDKY